MQQLLASHEEAYQVQNATVNNLQLQIKEMAENQQATIRQFQQRMEEIAETQSATLKQLQLQMELFANSHRQTAFETDDGSDAKELQQKHLSRQAQQDIHLSVREATGVSASPLTKTVPDQ